MSFQAGVILATENYPTEINNLLDSEKTETEKTEELVSRKSFSKNYRETPKVFRLVQLFNYAELQTFFPNLGKTYSTSLHKEYESYLM